MFTLEEYKYNSYFESKEANEKTALITFAWELKSFDFDPILITAHTKNENEEIKLRAKIEKKIEEGKNN